MKKKRLVLGILTAFLAIGTATFAAINSNKEATELDANYNDNVLVLNGLYVKVTDESTIQDGEKLLLVGSYYHTFQHLVGASYQYWMTTEYGDIDHAYADWAYLVDHKAELVTMKKHLRNQN